jgi:thiol-disulfide isomerase/thioredoxin
LFNKAGHNKNVAWRSFISVLLGVSFLGLLQGVEIGDLVHGRWALLFVVIPGCPACEKVLPWFSQAAQAFPEIRFLVVAPAATSELVGLAGDLPVYIDEGGALGWELGIRRAPTVVLLNAGIVVGRLDWPFTEGLLFRKLAESLLIEVKLYSPRELLGQLAPSFSAANLKGEVISFHKLPRPLFLVFVDMECDPCWEVLPILEELSQEIFVGFVAVTREVSETHRERLEEFLNKVKAKGGRADVLLDKWVEGEGFRILAIYKVGQSPTFILIDGKGVIAGVWEGRVEAEKLLEEVRVALAGVE